MTLGFAVSLCSCLRLDVHEPSVLFRLRLCSTQTSTSSDRELLRQAEAVPGDCHTVR